MNIRFCWKQSVKLAIATALITGGGFVEAASINIDNYSFEEPIHRDGAWRNAATGWVVTGSSGTWNPTIGKLAQGPTDGLQVGYSNQNGLGLSQTLSSVLTANTQYTLRVDVLSRTDSFTHQSSILELRTEDDIILASTSVGTIAAGSNELLTATYLASASDPNLGKNLKIALLAGGPQSVWDNVRLDSNPSAVPPLPATCIWEGKAPACNGDCRPGYTLAKRDKEGDGNKCVTGTKAYCYKTSDVIIRGTAPFCNGKCKEGEESLGDSDYGSNGMKCTTGKAAICRLPIQPTPQGSTVPQFR